jgi:hypothetical protein
MQKLTTLFLLSFISVAAMSQTQKINICIIDQKQLKTVSADYNQATGDTTLLANGKKKFFREVYPAAGREYAANASWYINNDAITIRTKKFVKYGLPRVLGTTDVVRAAEYKGVGVYVETGTKGVPDVIYIPARSGCEFQPYQRQL